jgi:cobalt/nickel transport system permease protein
LNADSLYLTGTSAVHRLPAQVKVVAAVAFVLVVVLTPREWVAAFAFDAALVLAAVVVAGLPLLTVARRMVVELPFILFALVLPFVGPGPEVVAGGLRLSEPGLWSAWNIVVKATLGVAISVVLAATTRSGDVVAALGRLRVPGLLVQIASFMVRYVDVVSAEAARMRTARAARGFTPSHLGSWPDLARSLGTLFVRSYERGERVQVAMLSRGYDGGSAPWDTTADAPGGRAWLAALSLPTAALIGAVTVAALP